MSSKLTGLFAFIFLVCSAFAVHASPFYATNNGTNSVVFYDDTGAPTISTFGTTGAAPVGIARDSAGNSYVPELTGGSIRKIAPAGGAGTVFASIGGGVAATISPDGTTLLVSSTAGFGGDDSVHRYTLATGAPLASITGVGNPRGITFANGGHVFIADIGGSVVREFDATTLGLLETYATGSIIPQGLSTGPDGTVYLGASQSGTAGGIYKLSGFGPTGTFSQFAVAPGGQNDRAVYGAIAPDGRLYSTNLANNQVDRFNGTTGAYIDSITGFSAPAYLAFAVPEPGMGAMLLGLSAVNFLRRRR